MRTILATLAILAGLAVSGPETAAQTSPCQSATGGVVNGIPCQRLPGRFYAPGAGTGVETEALLGFNVTDVSSASGTLTIDFIDSSGAADSLDFVGAEDGVLASATWSTATQTLTMTLADGTTIPVALSGLETVAEVQTAIAAAIANRLTRSDIVAGNNITITPGTGNSLEIAASGGGGGGGSNDGVVNHVSLTEASGDLTLTLGRSVGSDLSGSVALPGGGLSAVATDATLDGIGTTGDRLGIADGGVDTLQIADNAVTQAKLANNSVHAAQIGANAVGTSEISANAVGTSELSADAVTNANLADDSVHNDQLAANSVRADEIQANAVGHSEMQDAAVGVAELRDDAAERLCPDPGTGTSGQVCARNAAGDAYELVTQTGGGGGGGTDDQTAAEVSFDATGLTGTLAALPDSSNVAAALTAIDGFTLGGGGGGTPGTSEQRVESVTFADVDNITSTATTLTLAATTPIAVEFGDGTAEMLTGTAGETTFTIADSGVYMFEFSAIYPADGDRATPYVEIQQDSDDAVIGRSSNAYLRNSGSPEDGLNILSTGGVVSVPTDGLVVKAVLGNAYNQNSMDADGGKLSLVRIGTGLRGATGPAGPAGADGAGTTFTIHSLPAETTIAAGDSIPFSDTSDSNDPKRITRHNFGTSLAGTGIDTTATGQLELDIDEPALITTVADGDVVVLGQASDSFNTKRATLATLGTHFGTGGGGGTDDQTAAEVPYTSDAGGNLPATITEVQAALDAIDSFELENTFRGAYDSNRTYDGGEMVIYQGLEYISLIRNNTREPTRSEEQWSAQPRGYIFRGDAPVASTTYQQSHMVRIPSENSWYMATLQGGAQATRAQIPTHTDFQPFTNQLTDANVANASASIKGTISGEQLHDFAPELGIAEATSKVSDEFGRVSGRRIGEAIDAHVVPSTNATTDIGAASAIGTSLELSRDDHAHRLPIDNTLAFNSSDELSVNVHDVIETLQERIRYFTDVRSFTSDAGASVGQVYVTSPYDKVITKIEAHFAPLSGADSFIVRLDEVEENNSIKTKLFTSQTHDAPFPAGGQIRAFRFHDANGDPGVRIDGSIRLAILLSRTGDDSDSAVQCDHGAESDDSPAETYDDASVDFDLVNGVVYQHMNPAIGASTHSHDTQIRCNFRIFYEDILDHGNRVGDGNVNIDHLDSGSQPAGRRRPRPRMDPEGFRLHCRRHPAVVVEVAPTTRPRRKCRLIRRTSAKILLQSDDSVQDALETIDGFNAISGGVAAGVMAGRRDRHAERHRLHLSGQQPIRKFQPRHRRNGPGCPRASPIGARLRLRRRITTTGISPSTPTRITSTSSRARFPPRSRAPTFRRTPTSSRW